MKTLQPPHNPCTQHSFCLINCFALSIGTFGALEKSHHVNQAVYVQGKLNSQPTAASINKNMYTELNWTSFASLTSLATLL